MKFRRLGAIFWMWLDAVKPAPLTETVFLRLLGLIYITTFASFGPQIAGLVGSHGIAPAAQFMDALRDGGAKAYFEFPTILWFSVSDQTLTGICVAGGIAGLVLVSGFFTRIAAAACWILYLSIVTVGQPFSNFQWDALLLETGFLALFAGVPLTRLAFRFLLFRLMFESGLVKLLSHDPNWRNLQALRFHFMTQPLPNPLAYYAYRLPPWMLDYCTAITLCIELVAPFLLFGPRLFRRGAVALLMLLQVLILLTGNYAFFNLLTLLLCFWALDERTFEPLGSLLGRGVLTLRTPVIRVLVTVCVGLLMTLGAWQMIGMIVPPSPAMAAPFLRMIEPFDIVNTYGLFAIMTTTRRELSIEGSDDQVNWREYGFRYKPGELHRELPVVAPYQPRLDWQMWFAALGSPAENSWTGGLLYRLLSNEPSVTRLMSPAPFAKPPKFLRIQAYDYQFTTPSERLRTGAVWQRREVGTWFGPVSLKQ